MDYERGLDAFKQLAEVADWYQDFTVYEAPLRENLRDERRYGPSEQSRRDRARLIDQPTCWKPWLGRPILTKRDSLPCPTRVAM